MNNALGDLSGSLGAKAEIYQSGRSNGSEALISLQEPLLTPKVKRTSPCQGNRLKKEASEVSPGPPSFPEGLAPKLSHSAPESLLPWTKTSATQVIKIYNEDNTSRAVEVPSDIVARDICQLFALKSHCIDEHSLTLYEHLSHLGIERTIEDHESIMEVISSWGMDADNRLNFRKNYAKYEFFRKPLDFFPDHMVSISGETNEVVDHSQLVQIFLSASTCPEIHGHLHTKEPGKKSWKKLYFILRRSGLYVSSKGTSKDPWHLQFIADFTDSNVYTLLSAKKAHGAPTEFGFCVKSTKCTSSRDMKLLCADDEQTRTCWITAVRLFKYGMQLYQNFMQPHQKQKASPMGRGRTGAYPSYLRARGGVHPELVASQSQGTYKQTTIHTYGQFRVFNTLRVFGMWEETGVPGENPRRRGWDLNPGPQNCEADVLVHRAASLYPRSISENSLVAMDFSGQKSRVIENPSEVLSVAVQEGLAWRRKGCHRLSAHGSPSASQSSLNIALHLAQPWFHGKLSREEAQRLITQQGPVDGWMTQGSYPTASTTATHASQT
ncbi:growth factor receptor-bound protein 14 isoform X2 [Phyllopteryx taeniolatus]|uniref:growth factor receptor-bound protein 14 isoform X2 n=1 Tax=Phyllopteryx taeniolatus TaxID=161469 RepID=UPI002AD59D4D|nr:growth factor receptor-bound protein 14 isoform X2 [Phyllopteryx taeniolatus]